jgi:hypothetical protein
MIDGARIARTCSIRKSSQSSKQHGTRFREKRGRSVRDRGVGDWEHKKSASNLLTLTSQKLRGTFLDIVLRHSLGFTFRRPSLRSVIAALGAAV